MLGGKCTKKLFLAKSILCFTITKILAHIYFPRYLCEFIYYMSMNERLKPEFSSSSVLFVHVPMLDKPYSKENLAKTLKLIALEILS